MQLWGAVLYLAAGKSQGRKERKLVWPMLKARTGGTDSLNRLLAYTICSLGR